MSDWELVLAGLFSGLVLGVILGFYIVGLWADRILGPFWIVRRNPEYNRGTKR